MKILFIDFTLPYLLKDSEYPVGGWAVELQTWLKGIHAIEHKSGVISWHGATKYVNRQFDFELLDSYDPEKGLKILKYFYLYIPAILKAAKLYSPDIVIQACSGLNTGIMAFVANKLGIPFVYRVANDMDVDERYKTRLKKYEQIAYQYGLRQASAILCQNQYQYDCLQKKIPNKPLFTLHNPFDIDRRTPPIHSRAKKNYIAWLGVFSQQKNMSLLLQIAKELPLIKFKIAGMPANGIDKETSKAVDSLRELQNIEFVGYVKRNTVLNFLSEAIGLLSTSHYEGFSNTFLESFITGTPVIAPLRVDPDHIITKKKLGLTSKDDHLLADKVSKLCDMSEEQYNQMAKRCHSYVVESHAPAIKAKELIQVLQPIIVKR